MDDGTVNSGGVQLHSQLIPEPQAVSQAARDYLNTPFWAGDRARLDPDDLPAWRAAIDQVAEMFAPLAAMMLETSNATVEKADVGGATVYIATPEGRPDPAGRGRQPRTACSDRHGPPG